MDSAIRAEFTDTSLLATTYIWSLVHNGQTWDTNPSAMCGDKRRQNKVWRELVAGGYIAETVLEAEVNTQPSGKITRKAFDELPALPVDLASLYRFDIFDSDKGKAWVSWDQLTPGQKKTVVLAVEADPTAYTLMMCEPRYSPPKVEVFQLGGGREAMDKIGVSGWSFYISDAGVRAKDRAGRKAYYIKESLKTGLNWFLQKRKLMEKEEEVPVHAQTMMLGGYPALSVDPESWPAGLPATMTEVKDDIKALRQRLEVLEKFAKIVEDAGGWEKFTADYNAAIEEYVEGQLKKEETKTE
jgi:hypothetical protein